MVRPERGHAEEGQLGVDTKIHALTSRSQPSGGILRWKKPNKRLWQRHWDPKEAGISR